MALLKTRAEKVVDEILAGIEKSARELVKTHREGFRRVWEDQLTPDEVVAQMGNRAGAIMASSWALVQLLLTIDPNIMSESQYMPRRGLTFNPDGTVTLAPPPDGYDAWGRQIPPPPDQGGEGGGE